MIIPEQIEGGIENPAFVDGASTSWDEPLKPIKENEIDDMDTLEPKGPVLTVAPASLQASPANGKTDNTDQSYSQEQLELLLSPKNLQT